jgi:hypothetical protein
MNDFVLWMLCTMSIVPSVFCSVGRTITAFTEVTDINSLR